MQNSLGTLNMLSNWVIGFAWLAGLGGFVSGIALMAQTGGSYVGLGFGVIVAAFVQAVFVTWLAYLGKGLSAIGEELGAQRRDIWRLAEDRAAYSHQVAAAEQDRPRRWYESETVAVANSVQTGASSPN